MVKLRMIYGESMSHAFDKQVKGFEHSDMARFTTKDWMGEPIAAVKTIQTAKCTDAQKLQRDQYCDCDGYLRTATIGQLLLWKRYYWKCRKAGKTLKSYVQKHKKSRVEGAPTHMGYRAFFLKHCLLWDFLQFFQEYLGAMWVLDSASFEGQEFVVRARIVRSEAFKPPEEPKEARVERPRF